MRHHNRMNVIHLVSKDSALGLKARLKVWNKEVFGNAAVQKELALKQVGFRDSKEMDSPLLMEDEAARRAAKEEYCKWALIEEISWRQKSR